MMKYFSTTLDCLPQHVEAVQSQHRDRDPPADDIPSVGTVFCTHHWSVSWDRVDHDQDSVLVDPDSRLRWVLCD